MAYVANNPQYADAAQYSAKFKQLQVCGRRGWRWERGGGGGGGGGGKGEGGGVALNPEPDVGVESKMEEGKEGESKKGEARKGRARKETGSRGREGGAGAVGTTRNGGMAAGRAAQGKCREAATVAWVNSGQIGRWQSQHPLTRRTPTSCTSPPPPRHTRAARWARCAPRCSRCCGRRCSRYRQPSSRRRRGRRRGPTARCRRQAAAGLRRRLQRGRCHSWRRARRCPCCTCASARRLSPTSRVSGKGGRAGGCWWMGMGRGQGRGLGRGLGLQRMPCVGHPVTVLLRRVRL